MFGLKKKKSGVKADEQLHLINASDSFAFVEAYKTLRTNLTYLTEEDDAAAKAIMVASSIPNEGKTTVAMNLALSLAQDGKKVVLLDCDLRKGTLGRHLRISKQREGISTFLARRDFSEAEVLKALQYKSQIGLPVLSTGYVPDNPSELLGSDKMRKILDILGKKYQYIICDTAPIMAVADSLALGRYMDGAVLVVRQNFVTRDVVQSVVHQLSNINVSVLGVVLNQYDAKNTGGHVSHEYAYYSGYGYEKKVDEE